jgi:hypothetical protein
MEDTLSCECELDRVDRLGRLFGLDSKDRRRSCSVTALVAPGHERSVAGCVWAAFFAALEACPHAASFVSSLGLDCNIQDTKAQRHEARSPISILRAFVVLLAQGLAFFKRESYYLTDCMSIYNY